MKKMAQIIKNLNRTFTSEIITTEWYWRISPSSLELKRVLDFALGKYAHNKKVLDAGAGRLAYRKLITKYAKSYTSFDFEKTHDELDVVTDIEKMSFKNSSFEVVFCSQVIEHVPHPWKAFSEIHRVLMNKGIAIISVPMLGYIHNAPYDFYRYTEFGLQTLATEAGFTILSLEPVGGLFSFFGYIRSTLITPLFVLPLIGKLLLWFNFALSEFDIMLDRLIPNKKIFPLNYLLIVQKIK